MNKIDRTDDDLRLYYDEKCLVCSSDLPGTIIGYAQEHEYDDTTTFNFPVNQCTSCNLISLYPRPHQEELERIYPPTYYANYFVMKDDDASSRSWLLDYFYKKNLPIMKQKLSVLADRSEEKLRILDVGCGVGNWLNMMKDIFPNAETYGVEPSERACQKAEKAGHKVYRGMFEDVELQDNSFDLVISSHVIEHVARPDRFLEKCEAITKQDGYVLIETPNTDCLDFKLLHKKHWGGYHTPRHWYIFDTKNLPLLGKNVGLKAKEQGCYTAPIFWSWSAHSIFKSVFGNKVADFIFPPVTIFYGGLKSIVILGGFSVIESLILKFTSKASAMWILFEMDSKTSSD